MCIYLIQFIIKCLFILFLGPNMELVEIIQEKLIDCGLEIIENPHISLTKTVVLQYHWIQRFISDIKSKLTSIPRFLFFYFLLILV